MLSITQLGFGFGPTPQQMAALQAQQAAEAAAQAQQAATAIQSGVVFNPAAATYAATHPPTPDPAGSGATCAPPKVWMMKNGVNTCMSLPWYMSPWTYVGGGLAVAGIIGTVLVFKKRG